MNKLKALLFGVATCAVCLAASAGSKYALAVGVNAYLDDWQSGLSGCVTDARHMTDVLVNCGGWPANSVCQLVDEKATVANVRSAFKDLAGRVRSGDTVIVYWSSHGGYIYSSKTGTDKSSLCAYDAEYTDKMLAEDLGRFLSGVKVVVVIDTCCSGGLFQTATVGGNAKAADSTFAQRVDALLSRSKAGGIAASEVGWMTAVAYNQSSMDASPSIGGRYTGNCLVYDGIYWGKADTDKDGDISFLDLHNHARKWFSEDAEWARYEACFGTISAEKKDALSKKMQKFSPQMLHEDVLASVLVRDRAVAGGNKYPFKVEFYTLCNGELDSLITKGDVQFVWPGESAVEPTLVSDNDYAFVGWDTDFTDVRKDLIVRGTYVEMSAAETFIEVAETVKKFVGFTLAECEDPQTSNIYQYVTATFDGVYAKGGRLTVTLTGVDGTKDKFSGQLDDVSFEGFFMAELTSSKSDDTIVIKMSTSAVYGTYRHGDAEYSIEGNWDWVSTRETLAQAVRERYAAVYNVGMEVDFFFGGREGLSNEVGYVNVVLSEQNGKAKVTGVLGDGTKISVTTKAIVPSTLNKAVDKEGFIYVPIVFARTDKRSGFSGLLALYVNGDGGERMAKFYGRAYWDSPAQGEEAAFQVYLVGTGSEFVADKMPKTVSTDMPHVDDVPPLYVKVDGQLVELVCETNALPSRHSLAYANGKFKVTDPQPDDAKLTLTLNKRTGVVTGSFRVWYVDDPTNPSVKKSVMATVHGGWVTCYNSVSAFGLVLDTHPDRAKLKLKVPIELIIKEAAASVVAGEN